MKRKGTQLERRETWAKSQKIKGEMTKKCPLKKDRNSAQTFKIRILEEYEKKQGGKKITLSFSMYI